MRARLASLLAGAIGIAVLAIPAIGHAATSGPAKVACGGPAASPFVADTNFSGGSTVTRTNSIDMTAVANLTPAPSALYQSQRYGNFTYTFGGFTASSMNTVRLHFADTHWTTPGNRSFNVSINGTQVLTGFDIVGVAGAGNRAIIETFSTLANSSGQYVITFTTVKDAASVSGIEVNAGTYGFTQINAGGPAVAPYIADTDFSGGSTVTRTNSIDMSNVVNQNPAPASVYQSQRFGNFSYTIGGFDANSSNLVRLHFCDTHWTSAGQRVFNVTINGVPALTSFDVVAQAGGGNKALIESFTMLANSAGQYVIQFSTITDSPTVSGIEVLSPTSQLQPVNLALGKPTSQSSVANGGVPSRAVDGVSDSNFAHGSVTQTGNDVNAWWEVDLGTGRNISEIEIDFRTDSGLANNYPFMVITSNDTIFDSDMVIDPPLDGVSRAVIEGPVNSVVTVPINRMARTVRVALTGQNVLSIAEVKVFEQFNSARGRSATQSSTRLNGDASHAVDGNINGVYGRNEVAATNSEKNPWWQVDMGLVSFVREVDVWSGNSDCCMTTGPLYRVYASPTPFTSDPSVSLPPGAFQSITEGHGTPTRVFIGVNARYIRVQMVGTDSLALSEVQVFSSATGSFGGHAKLYPPDGVVSGVDPYSLIDLNPNGGSSNPVVASTANEPDPYFEVDLGGDRYIESVRVWGEAFSSSSKEFSIFVSEEKMPDSVAAVRSDFNALEYLGFGSVNDSTTTIMNRARFVRIQLQGSNQVLGLNEVEIVTTQGYVVNPASGLTSTSASSTTHVTGFHTRPGVDVDMYQFDPGASTGGGFYNDYTYLFSTLTSTTPQLTSLATVPVYAFDMGNVPLSTVTAAKWANGGIAPLYVQADDFPGINPVATPLRTVDADGTISGFGPTTRLVSTSPTPDDTSDTKTYLTIPMPATANNTGYYNLLAGPSSNPTYFEIPATLAGFQSQYGMTSSTAVNAKYYNAGDLGIGRNMTCNRLSWKVINPNGTKPTGLCPDGTKACVSGVACAVSNFAPPSGLTSPPNAPILFGQQATCLAELTNGTAPFATVVMVKRDGATAATFGVYLGGTSANAGQRIQSNVFLDSKGINTQVPNNCVPCHGGLAGSNPLAITNDSFLPFDPGAFRFGAAGSGTDYASQAEAFRKLNSLVKSSKPAQAIVDFIDGTYHGNVDTVGQAADLTWVPPGWSHSATQTKVYNGLIKYSCRGCHWSQGTNGTAAGGLDFSDGNFFDGALSAIIVSDVCAAHKMPQSQLVTKNTWGDQSRALLLGYTGRLDTGVHEYCKAQVGP
ncbi:MAG TPA: malectin domain-containing carbohydrate-binding protein [Polyangia bacterium]|nr:malectin domain-containing carbohydrate-binding protein [Polyangia bacterium]